MSTEKFKSIRFKPASLAVIEQANRIIAEYAEAGFTLTLRQLYYQFVARGLIPNSQREYKKLGSTVDNGRVAGLIDWAAIEDRTRRLRRHASWDSPKDILEGCAYSYRLNPWSTQKVRPEVWIEKDALIGVIEPVCEKFKVPYFACRGYNSQSEAYKAGKRHELYIADDLKPLVLHLGDHDPSGIDMTRDNTDRLDLFARSGVEVRRLALNWDQVQQYRPPPNPAKETDSRCAGYVAEYGHESWELDALDPKVKIGRAHV
jgi:hypothetical protein